MGISKWINAGTVLKVNAFNYPEKLGWQDLHKEYTFKQWNERSCRFANGLKDLGVGMQEPFAVLAYNRGEWMDIYAGCAKGGQIVVPIMFRLSAVDIEYIMEHSQSKALIVEQPFVETINGIRDKLVSVPKGNFIYLGDGPAPEGYIGFEEWLAKSSPEEPKDFVDSASIWTIMYTSGTTGRPKGVMKTHESYMAQYFVNNINMGVRPTDKVMLVMPMCHVNSIFYSFPYTLVSAPVFVYNMVSFDPKHMLETIDKYNITFTSLVPTHYIMLLATPGKEHMDVSSMRQLLISSAPARKDLKMAIMEYFKNAELWEAYGTTEGGLVTLLRPEDQFKKLGSIGKEVFGTDRLMFLDENQKEVADGEVGELYYRTPMLFKEYLNLPEKSKEAFLGEYSSAGDMGYRDPDGYYVLVDRKANMIITGGENVYPSDIEGALGAHEAIKDMAVIGIPDEKWGELVMAIVVLHEGFSGSPELVDDIKKFGRGKLAGFKIPKKIEFIKDEEMPRTPTGKILHRILREKYGTWAGK